MKANRLLQEIGQVDSKFIEDSAPESKQFNKSKIKKIIAVAACFAVIFSVGLGLWQSNIFSRKEIVTLDNGNEFLFYESDSARNSQNIDLDVTPRKLTANELSLLFGDLPVTANGLFDKNTLIGIEGEIKGMKIILSREDVNLKDTVIEGQNKQSTVNNVPVNGGYFITKANSKGEKTAIYYADFEVGDKKIYVENAGNENEKEQIKNDLASIISQLTEFTAFNFELISQ